MNIENMLPFLNKQALDELVDSIIAGEVDFDIRKALPFLDDDAREIRRPGRSCCGAG